MYEEYLIENLPEEEVKMIELSPMLSNIKETENEGDFTL